MFILLHRVVLGGFVVKNKPEITPGKKKNHSILGTYKKTNKTQKTYNLFYSHNFSKVLLSPYSTDKKKTEFNSISIKIVIKPSYA